MMQKYNYIGCFVPEDLLCAKLKAVRETPLSRPIRHPHVTFSYRPDSVDEGLFGEKVTIRVSSYGNNGINEGVAVSILAENRKIAEMAEKIRLPHITLSVSPDGKPVNTAYLAFSPIEPFEITGVFGGYLPSGQVVTERLCK